MSDDTPRCVIEAAHARWVEAARPVPPETLADEPPRDAEGMLIGWPVKSGDEAWARRTMTPICRAHGLDPDGPLEPMRPAAVWQREGERRPERVYREARDAALIAALGKLR